MIAASAYTDQNAKDFIKIMDSIKPSRNRYEVFSDWLITAAASLYAPWKKCQSAETEYTEIANQYTKDELDKHAGMLAITANALEEKEQDFLGEVFTKAELANSKTGQFFTPYHISCLMAEIAIGDSELPNNRILRINEPCCGAGGMMIAGISVLKKRGFNYQRDAFFAANDIDAVCARMAYIQLSLLAAPAVVTCGNALTLETYWQRETFGYHTAGMERRLRAENMLEKIEEPGQPEAAQAKEKMPVKISLPPSRELAQGELF